MIHFLLLLLLDMFQLTQVGPTLGQAHQFLFYHSGKSEFAEEKYINYSKRIYQTLIWGSSFALGAVLLTTVFNATNPEYNFPGITETLLIGVSFLLVANSFFFGKTLTSREWLLVGILLLLIGTLAIRYLLGWSDQESSKPEARAFGDEKTMRACVRDEWCCGKK